MDLKILEKKDYLKASSLARRKMQRLGYENSLYKKLFKEELDTILEMKKLKIIRSVRNSSNKNSLKQS